MAFIRQIKHSFAAAYVRPTMVERTVQQLIPSTQHSQPQNQHPRRPLDRRCGRDRRQQNRAVLYDLRSPYSRRKNSRRGSEMVGYRTGIDTYA